MVNFENPKALSSVYFPLVALPMFWLWKTKEKYSVAKLKIYVWKFYFVFTWQGTSTWQMLWLSHKFFLWLNHKKQRTVTNRTVPEFMLCISSSSSVFSWFLFDFAANINITIEYIHNNKHWNIMDWVLYTVLPLYFFITKVIARRKINPATIPSIHRLYLRKSTKRERQMFKKVNCHNVSTGNEFKVCSNRFIIGWISSWISGYLSPAWRM